MRHYDITHVYASLRKKANKLLYWYVDANAQSHRPVPRKLAYQDLLFDVLDMQTC